MSVTFVAITSAFFGAIAWIFARLILKDIDSKNILAINFITMGLMLLCFSPLFYHFDFSYLSVGLVVLLAILDMAWNYFYFKTFEKTQASIAVPMLSLAPVFTFIFASLFLQDTVSIQSLILSLSIFVLVIIFSTDFSSLKEFKTQTLWPALTASFLFGISAIPAKYLLDTLWAINAPTLYMFRSAIIGSLCLFVFGFKFPSFSSKKYGMILLWWALVILQRVFLYYAIGQWNAGVSVTLWNITPVFVFILSIVFLKEKPTWKKLIISLLILALSFLL